MTSKFTSDDYADWIQSKPTASKLLSSDEITSRINTMINEKVDWDASSWDTSSKEIGRPVNHTVLPNETRVIDLTVGQLRNIIQQEVSVILNQELSKLNYYQFTPTYVPPQNPWTYPTVYCESNGEVKC